MIFKLAMGGIQRRFRDYLVLFSGLSIGSAIFYMFSALATNEKFLKASVSISLVSQVFMFGLVLLSLITIVYVGYAQSFLMSMRHKDYGLFLMFGAKPRKISQLIILETLMVHLSSVIVGIVVGMGLTKVASQWLASQINFSLKGLNVISGKAAGLTLALFAILAVLCALFSVVSVARKPLNAILKADQSVNPTTKKSWLLALESIIGVALLAVGFYAMIHINTLKLSAIPVALVTISLGTYFVIHALFSLIISALRRANISFRQLRLFTLGQLQFRIQSYTKVLSMVTILFAMALGAIVVGLGYHRQIPIISSHSSAYSMQVVDPNAHAKKLIGKLKLQHSSIYHEVTDDKTIYLNQQELKDDPYQKVKEVSSTQKLGKPKFLSVQKSELTDPKSMAYESFLLFQKPADQRKKIVVLKPSQFEKQAGTKHKLHLMRVNDLTSNAKILKQLSKYSAGVAQNGVMMINAYDMYVFSNAMFGGLEFIGLFLGIAFLTMLASCLMFKVLSGTAADVHRYQMLFKIGVPFGKLKAAMAKEIGVLFIIPGIAGIAYVGVGLQMFKQLMVNPYYHWYWAVLGFAVCYGLYYLLTLWLYQKLVLPSQPKGGE
ncbi:FtsX-like permease family protein [Paucilactobacillus sp. N302-9]